MNNYKNYLSSRAKDLPQVWFESDFSSKFENANGELGVCYYFFTQDVCMELDDSFGKGLSTTYKRKLRERILFVFRDHSLRAAEIIDAYNLSD